MVENLIKITSKLITQRYELLQFCVNLCCHLFNLYMLKQSKDKLGLWSMCCFKISPHF